MARCQKFLAAEFSQRFGKSYAGLTVGQQNGALWVVDVVPHDDIDRYGRKVDGLF